MKIVQSNIKIKKEDWDFLKSALITYSIEPFQSSSLQHKVKEILKKYS